MARTWLETLSGSKTSSAPRSSTASDPASTRNAALGSRLAMTVLAAKRDVVIQIEPPAKLKTAGLTSGVRPARSASIPIVVRPRIALASRVRRIAATLGLQGLSNPIQRALQAVAHRPVEPARYRGSDHRGRRLIRDVQLDPHAVRDLLEAETSLLLDQPGFRDPADLLGTAPAVKAQHVFKRQSKQGHLHRVARAGPRGLGPDGFPSADALEHVRNVPIVGEVVEGPLRRGLGRDPGREFQSRHQSKICVW